MIVLTNSAGFMETLDLVAPMNSFYVARQITPLAASSCVQRSIKVGSGKPWRSAPPSVLVL